MPEQQTITATHLRENLGAVLEAALLGRTVHVIRNGRPLCTITPPQVAAEKSPTTSEEDR